LTQSNQTKETETVNELIEILDNRAEMAGLDEHFAEIDLVESLMESIEINFEEYN
jgi:hypothetical protein